MSLIDDVIRREYYLPMHDLIIEEAPEIEEVEKISKLINEFDYTLERLEDTLSQRKGGDNLKKVREQRRINVSFGG